MDIRQPGLVGVRSTRDRPPRSTPLPVPPHNGAQEQPAAKTMAEGLYTIKWQKASRSPTNDQISRLVALRAACRCVARRDRIAIVHAECPALLLLEWRRFWWLQMRVERIGARLLQPAAHAAAAIGDDVAVAAHALRAPSALLAPPLRPVR
eukprot:3524084-Prymnesium_polylepis.1